VKFDFEIKSHKFHSLMPHRVREVLVVSSPYEAFTLEEDASLTEQIFTEYSELNLTSAPRVTHVTSGEEALQALQERRFDLVIPMIRLADMDVFALGRKIKELRPGRPVVMLALDDNELKRLPQRIDPLAIDKVFLWSGDAQILLAIIKFIEDKENADHDISKADVRVIIVVEDNIRYYSSYLGLLYSELMTQSQSLIAEGLNDLHKLMRMRARPKILLASTYEEAVAYYDKYKNNVLALITDVRFPRQGKLDDQAGFALLNKVRTDNPTMPILLQSAEEEVAERASEIGAIFCNKNSPSLLMEIHNFLKSYLGFGDFIFRLPDGKEVGRAKDLRELEQLLPALPLESLEYHALRNHISNWLMARCEFELAERLKPQKVSDFKSLEELREYLIHVLEVVRKESQEGVITDFSKRQYDPTTNFIRLSTGSLGGKARGIAFINSILSSPAAREKLKAMKVKIPQTFVLGTDVFDSFMEINQLRDFAYACNDDLEIANRFIKSQLPRKVVDNLRYILERIDYPLAVRSSSLLEDSHFQPFAGIYSTFMLPNNNPEFRVRLEDLCDAIKLVFASIFSKNAKSYIEATLHRIEEEKMGVVIQRLVGKYHNDRFYPHFAGVLQSYNFYPIGHQKPDDGIATIALGLGRIVMEGGQAMRFCPKYPEILPQFSSPQAVVKNSQKYFYALEMVKHDLNLIKGQEASLTKFNLEDAEQDGTLESIGSVYSAADNIIRDGLNEIGPRLVTFSNVLKWKSIPLTETLDNLLDITRFGMGCPVEIEFAVDLGNLGKPVLPDELREDPTLYFLQIRPLITRTLEEGVDVNIFAKDQMICYSKQSMGFGCIQNIFDLVYVKHDLFNPAHSRLIAQQVGQINEKLAAEKRPYILMGPGRWGSSDYWLGIPVQWSQISGAKLIVEASLEGFSVDPSQGTHFFQNITSLRIGYMTVQNSFNSLNNAEEMLDFVDWKWLDLQPALMETDHLRLIRVEQPFVIRLDGQSGNGAIAKPGSIGCQTE